MKNQNSIGGQVRRFRSERGWTQSDFAARCQVSGWNVSRGSMAKIEARIRGVTDAELYVMAEVLGVSIERLFPKDSKLVKEILSQSFPEAGKGRKVAEARGRYRPRAASRRRRK